MTTQIAPMEAMRGTLTKMAPEFGAALPSQIPVEKFTRIVLTALQMNPDLLACDRMSFLGSAMKSAQDGLLPDGRESAFVIFNTKNGKVVQYMPMVGGLLKKIRNSGELASISANIVYENDLFEYELGDYEAIKHRPILIGDRGKAIAAYAIARTKDGAIYREVMSVAEIDKVRASSRAANAGPWVQWWDEMARKTVIRRIAKRLPSSADFDQVIASDNEVVGFAEAPIVATVEPSLETASKPNKLRSAIIDIDHETGEITDGSGISDAGRTDEALEDQ